MTRDTGAIAPTLTAIAELFPAAFAVERWLTHRPLKIGIHLDLVERGILAPNETWILRAYISRRMYQQALAAGGPRYDLGGNVAGEVTEEQAALAAKAVTAIDSAHAAKAAQAAEARRMLAHTLRRNALPRVWKVFPEGHPEPPAKAPAPATAPAPQRLSLAGLKAAARARQVANAEAAQ